jgi:hypothetical protein
MRSKYKPVKLKTWANITTQISQNGTQRFLITNLHAKAKDLPVKIMPLECLNVYNLKIGNSELKNFAMHMKAVMDADLKYPIILDDEGFVMDGRHRIAKALFEGKTYIKFVRFEETPEPDYYDKDD